MTKYEHSAIKELRYICKDSGILYLIDRWIEDHVLDVHQASIISKEALVNSNDVSSYRDHLHNRQALEFGKFLKEEKIFTVETDIVDFGNERTEFTLLVLK